MVLVVRNEMGEAWKSEKQEGEAHQKNKKENQGRNKKDWKEMLTRGQQIQNMADMAGYKVQLLC